MKIAALLLIRCNNHPWVQRILYNSWFGKQEEGVIDGENRIRDIADDDNDDEAFVYDGDARVRGSRHGNGGGGYLDEPAGESDRLLGNGDGAGTGDVRRGIYDDVGADDDRGFGAVQPSLFRA